MLYILSGDIKVMSNCYNLPRSWLNQKMGRFGNKDNVALREVMLQRFFIYDKPLKCSELFV